MKTARGRVAHGYMLESSKNSSTLSSHDRQSTVNLVDAHIDVAQHPLSVSILRRNLLGERRLNGVLQSWGVACGWVYGGTTTLRG
jgi:hypothetical protein